MKIRYSKFLKFEAMMFVSAIITCIIFQLIMALLSGTTYHISYHLVLLVLLCLPHLIGGIATWELSHKYNNWVELALKQIIFANVLLVIPTVFWSLCCNFHSPDLGTIMTYDLICAMCSIPSIMLCCYLYYHLSKRAFSSHKK